MLLITSLGLFSNERASWDWQLSENFVSGMTGIAQERFGRATSELNCFRRDWRLEELGI